MQLRLMKCTKRKIGLLSVIAILLVVSIGLCFVFLSMGRNRKDGSEICLARDCLFSTESNRQLRFTSTTVCMPSTCELLKEEDHDKICMLKECTLEGSSDDVSDGNICITTECLRSAKELMDSGDVCMTEECVIAASEVLKMLDQNADPCEDFYEYSCGNFFRTNTIPDGQEKFSVFDVAQEKVAHRVRDILERPLNTGDSDALRKAKTLYSTCMDTTHFENSAVADLKDVISAKGVGVWPTLEKKWNDCRLDLEWRMAKLNAHGVDSFFRLSVQLKGNDHRYYGSIHVSPPLINGICDNDTTTDNSSMIAKVKEYTEVLNTVLSLLNSPEKTRDADIEDIIRFDYEFCNVTKPSRESTPSHKRSNQTLQDLISIASEINWSRWHNIIFSEFGLNTRVDQLPLYVYDVDKSIDDIVDLLHRTSARIVANYLTWKFVLHHLGYLSQPFRQIMHDHETLFQEGRQFQMEAERWTPRWKQCEKYVERLMTIALIPTYLSELMTSDMQIEMTSIVSLVRSAFKDTFRKTPGLKLDEKIKSVHKIDRVNVRLFYPDKDKRFYDEYYSKMGYLGPCFLKNGMKARLHHFKKAFEGVLQGKNVYNIEHTVTLYNPFEMNAWSAFPGNLIVLYYAVIQSTGVSVKRPKYLNFATFGTLIGHEFAHGFDLTSVTGKDQFGRRAYNWTVWPDYVIRYVEKNSQCFIEQYSAYNTSFFEEQVDGNRTVNDNLADNQGMKEVFKAYRNYIANHRTEKYLPGLNYTNEQLFFTKYAQFWCSLETPEYAAIDLDHSPVRERVNGVLRNMEAFAEAFGCPSESTMNPMDKCKNLW